MKKILFYIGIGGIGYALVRYFNKQYSLALDWDFKVKSVNLLYIDKKRVKLNLKISILNKSIFELIVKNYDLNIVYENVKIGNAKTSTPFTVNADSWFDVPVIVDLEFDKLKGVLDDFGINLLLQKPMYIDIVGDMNIQISKIKKKIIFNKKDVLLTENLGKDIGISKTLSDVTGFLDKLGIKI